MAERCPEAQIAALAAELRQLDSALSLLGAESPTELERLSRDYYEYSPVLVPLLQGCRAQLVARATTAMLAAASRSASRSQLRCGNRAMLLAWLQVIATARRCSNTN